MARRQTENKPFYGPNINQCCLQTKPEQKYKTNINGIR